MSEQNNKEADEVVLYEVRDAVALVTMNRPEYHNAQNSRMTYALMRPSPVRAPMTVSRSSSCAGRQALLRRARHRHPRA